MESELTGPGPYRGAVVTSTLGQRRASPHCGEQEFRGRDIAQGTEGSYSAACSPRLKRKRERSRTRPPSNLGCIGRNGAVPCVSSVAGPTEPSNQETSPHIDSRTGSQHSPPQCRSRFLPVKEIRWCHVALAILERKRVWLDVVIEAIRQVSRRLLDKKVSPRDCANRQ